MALSESRKFEISKEIEKLNLTQAEAVNMLIGTLMGLEQSLPGTDMLTPTVAIVKANRIKRGRTSADG